nr:unnamed protein product [Callosobruchus analis]
MLKERPELFLQNGSVRPGILVLVNDADWELMNEEVDKNRHILRRLCIEFCGAFELRATSP